MEKITSEKFLVGCPHKLTQYVRGELFILIDNILKSEQKPSTPEQLIACVDFIKKFIKIFIQFLKILPEVNLYKN